MSIAENITRVEDQISAACRRANRPRESVLLMAVSKMHPAEAILEAHQAGLRVFGENRVQEYAGKRVALAEAGILDARASVQDHPTQAKRGLEWGTRQPVLAKAGAPPNPAGVPGDRSTSLGWFGLGGIAVKSPVEVHCIGPVQSNKAVRAVELFDAIDSVDSLRLAERLEVAARQSDKKLPVSIEIKLSPEPSKHGLVPDSTELAELLERLPDLTHLHVCGLMTVPPWSDDPEPARPYFRQLRKLRDSLARQYPHLDLRELSMGMSHDFAVAIEEGATTVRVGTAIFGARSATK